MPEMSYEDLLSENRRLKQELEKCNSRIGEGNIDDELYRIDLYTQMLDAAGESIIATDRDGKIIYWNKYAEQLFGWTADEVLGKPILDYTPTKMSLKQAEQMMEFLADGRAWQGEFHVKNKFGDEFWINIKNSPLYDSKGKIAGILGVSTNITRRKEYQTELRHSELKFRKVLENISLIAIMLDTDGKISYANKYFLELTGWDKDEIIGKSWFDNFIPETEANDIKDILQKTINENIFPQTHINCILTKSGEKKTISWSNVTLLDENNEVENITSLGIDITEKQIIENKLKESEERYRKLVENSPTGIITIDVHGKIIDINPKLLEILGSPSEEVTKQINFFQFKPLIEAGVTDAFKKCIDEREYITSENPYLSKWGKQTYLRYHIVPIINEQGEVEKLQATVEDFTEKKQTELELLEFRERFESFMKHLPGAVFIKDGKRILFANEFFAKQIGKTPEEIIGKELSDYSKESTEEEFAEENKEIFEKQKILISEHEFKFGDETTHWITYKFPIHAAEGKIYLGAISLDVTETVEAREQLKFQSMLLDQIRDVVTATDLEGRITYVNKAEVNSMKMSKDELIGKKVEVYGEDPLEGATQKEIVENTLKYGEWRGEVVNFNKYGDRIYFDVRTTLLKDDNGDPIGLLGISTDITEMKRTEHQLNKTKNMLTLAQNIAHLGSWEHNLRTGDTIWSEEFFRICGYKPHSLIPDIDTILKTIHPGDRKDASDAFEGALNQGEMYSLEHRIVRPDGEIRYVLSQGEVILDEKNEPEVLIGSFLDTTERKKAEIALESKLFALTEPNVSIKDIKLTDIIGIDVLQEIQDKFAESFDVPVVIYDRNGNYITKKSNYSDFCDYVQTSESGTENCRLFDQGLIHKLKDNPVPTITKNCSIKNMITGTVPIIVEGIHLANIGCGQMIDMDFDLEEVKRYAKEIGLDEDKLKEMTKDLRKVDYDKFDKIVEFLFVIAKQISDFGYQNLQQARFIAEQKKYEKELMEAKNRAEASDRLKTAFLANMSHEIRTPMNGIIGFSQLLKSEDVSGEEISEYANIINTNANQLLKLINDVIDLSKIESGELTVNSNYINIDSLLEKVYNTFIPEAKKNNVELNIIKPSDLTDTKIHADEVKIIQVLNNLISNALKFTEEGEISFGYEIKEKFVIFKVSDTGVGIPENELEKIFKRFYQVEDYIKKTKSGAGLGLSISKALAEMMGGSLWAESEPGTGSTFYFKISLSQGFEEEDEMEEVTVNIDELANKDFSVLIVEDDDTNLLLFKRILSGTKAKIYSAMNGQEAIDVFEKNPGIDVILMDLKMPVVNGFEATRRIKKISPDTPVIAQTAYAFSNDAKEALDAGCDDYISKPIEIDKLFQKILRHIKK